MAYFGFTNKLLKGETIQIFNYGNCRRDFTYVDDIVEGVYRVMQKAPERKKGEIHALLGENGAGKSTLMSVLFGLYQAEEGIIKKDGVEVSIKDPNDANALGIGMVHQHFKLVECFTVLDNIIMGVEPTKCGFLQKKDARAKVIALSEKYGLKIDPDALIEDIMFLC